MPEHQGGVVKGIPFSDVMVRAVLAGHKTQTRRLKDTYRVGDQLYIREAWRAEKRSGEPYYQLRADGSIQSWPGTIRAEHERVYARWSEAWRPARFMFRALSRAVVLEVVERRVEPLQDITEEDARAEGSWTRPDFRDTFPDAYAHAFHEAWDTINGATGDASWNANPTVYAYTFRVKPARAKDITEGLVHAGAAKP